MKLTFLCNVLLIAYVGAVEHYYSSSLRSNEDTVNDLNLLQTHIAVHTLQEDGAMAPANVEVQEKTADKDLMHHLEVLQTAKKASEQKADVKFDKEALHSKQSLSQAEKELQVNITFGGEALSATCFYSLKNEVAWRDFPEFAAGASVEAKSAVNGSQIHVLYAVDVNVLKAVINSMTTIAQHATFPLNYTIHLVVPENDIPKFAHEVACYKGRVKTHLKKMAPQVEIQALKPHPFVGRCAVQAHLTGVKTSFARFYIPEYVPNAERVIYLDSDTIVRSDLQALYQFPLAHAFGAVKENNSFMFLYGGATKHISGRGGKVLNKNFTVFNDGVLLVDVQKWKAVDFAKRLEWWAAHLSVLGDQMILNLEAQGFGHAFDELPITYNHANLCCKMWNMHQNFTIDHWSCGPKPWNRHDATAQFYASYTSGAAFQLESCPI